VKRLILAAILLVAVLASPGLALAQDMSAREPAHDYSRGFNVSVLERPHPDWAPVDIDLGGLSLRPELDLTTAYDTNEKDAPDHARSDGLVLLRPAVAIASDTARRQLAFDADLTRTEHLRFGEDDSTEYDLAGEGRFSVSQAMLVGLQADDQHRVLPRSDPDIPIDSLGPVMFDRQDFRMQLEDDPGRWQVRLAAALRAEAYGSVGAPGGGVYSFSARNGVYASGSGRAGWAVSPAVSFFAEGLYSQTFRPAFAGRSQDARGASLLAGVSFDLSHLARGEVSAGLLRESYSTPATPADMGIALHAELQYFPTQLTTLTVTADRNAAPPSIAGSPGGLLLGGSVRLDHELLRNLVLSLGAEARRTDYRDFQVHDAYQNRTDRSESARLGARYLMNRLATWELSWSRTDTRSSFALRRSYSDGQLSLSLRLRR
jgi:hypothetical protein